MKAGDRGEAPLLAKPAGFLARRLARFATTRPAGDIGPPVDGPSIFPRRTPTSLHQLLSINTESLVGTRLLTALAPVILAEHPDLTARGSPSYWFLGRNGEIVAKTLDGVPETTLARMRDTWAMAASASANGEPAALDALRADFVSLHRGFGLELMRRLFAQSALPPMSLVSPPLTGDDRDLCRLEINQAAGGLSLVVDGKLEFPILMEGNLVPCFVHGWRPTSLITCFAPFVIIELENDSGRRASWVLDQQCRRICDEGFAAPEVQAQIRQIAPFLIRQDMQRLLDSPDDRGDQPLDSMFRLNPVALTRIFWLCHELVRPPVEEVSLASLPERLLLPACAGQPTEIVLARHSVAEAVRHDLFEAGVAALRSGRFVWPSPVDGSEAELEAIFPLQEYTILYQFRDRNGLSFIVLTGDRRAGVIGLLIPAANLVIGDIYEPDRWFRAAVGGGGIWFHLLAHCMGRREMMAWRRRRPDSRIVNVFMGPPLLHIGHYVWNDLSGQMALAADVPDHLPTSIVFSSPQGQAEFFGPIDRIIPALSGRVDRTLPHKEEFIRWSLESGTVPIRFTKDYVSRALRNAVRASIEATEPYRQIAQTVRRDLRDRLIIILGIRLDDRTLIDNDGFYVWLLDHLDRRHPGTVLVFDGRNAKPGGAAGEMIVGMKDHLATTSPVEAEQALVDRISARFSASSLKIVSTIGQPMPASMAWCYQARCCVAPWGAGHAKYRWLANLPTLTLTSRFNIEKRPDLDIYHAPRWMEDPAPMLYPDPLMVTDHLDQVGLADSQMRVGRELFDIDRDHVAMLLDQLIDMTR